MNHSKKLPSKKTAILLALLIGGLGIHRFYLGGRKGGFIFLVFFITGIPGLVALFDAFGYYRAKPAEWMEKHSISLAPQ
ncbi:hypothetical protein SRABI118_01138 [Massilia sp. Bi118]|uniref:NINE protein n=1 Tax=Massilia sp. Bi118 TaxID=2822346 RepID=UPI001D328F77|nr:NINE protein [Massilia sp. Bi118]CAH0177036.1 hypothetical protein SRABI118_01138 [Massilia sp. Bi118]